MAKTNMEPRVEGSDLALSCQNPRSTEDVGD